MSEINICTTPGCLKEAHLSCPTCIKLGLPGKNNLFIRVMQYYLFLIHFTKLLVTLFCNQECFKSYWNQHKAVHKSAIPLDPLSLPIEFTNFEFTGSLRPTNKSPKRSKSLKILPSHHKSYFY